MGVVVQAPVPLFNVAMKRRTSGALLLLVAAVSCRQSGPLGIHKGDVIQPAGEVVTAVGEDWIEVGGRRASAEQLPAVEVECPHK
jgi:hypothetical protein